MSKTIYTKDPAKRFYVYAFLREDDTPYYIGKGQGNRAWGKRQFRPDDSRISILKGSLTETEAFSEEIRLIQFHGRKDLGTGCLRNLTDGGEGSSGYKHTQDTLDKLSEANTGEKSPRFGKRHTQDARDKLSAALSGENNHMFGKKRSQDTRDKQSAAQSGEKNHMYGKTGEKCHNFGKRHTQDTRDKMSGENHPMYGKRRSPESIAKGLATRKRNKEAKSLLSLVEENS